MCKGEKARHTLGFPRLQRAVRHPVQAKRQPRSLICAFCDKAAGRALMGAATGAKADDAVTGCFSRRAPLSDGENAWAHDTASAQIRQLRTSIVVAKSNEKMIS